MASELPRDIQAVIAWLVEQAKGYKSIVDGTPRLQSREVEGFKSDLMLRTSRWLPDRVPPAAFSAECISAGLPPNDTAKLVDPLRGVRPESGWFRKGNARAGHTILSSVPLGCRTMMIQRGSSECVPRTGRPRP